MIEDRLRELEITLPDSVLPLGLYLPCVQAGRLLYLSMILPIKDGSIMATGKVGRDISIEQAGECARQVIINALAIAKSKLGSLDKIKQCVKLSGYVASSEDFYEHPKVMNYASGLLIDIDDRCRHSRSVVGVASLPMNSPVAMDFIFELHGTDTDKD